MAKHLRSPRKRLAAKGLKRPKVARGLKRAVRAGVKAIRAGITIPKLAGPLARRAAKKRKATANRGLRRTVGRIAQRTRRRKAL